MRSAGDVPRYDPPSAHRDAPEPAEPERIVPIHDMRPDQELLGDLRAGNIGVFETLFFRYHPALCTFAFRYVESEAIAEELVQETFLFMWERRDSWSFTGDGLRRYLFTAVRNAATSHLRHQQVERRTTGDVIALMPTPDAADRHIGSEELAVHVQRAIARLPERCREVLTLHRDQGMTYGQIADVLGIAPKTVEVHMGRAFKLLRTALARFRP